MNTTVNASGRRSSTVHVWQLNFSVGCLILAMVLGLLFSPMGWVDWCCAIFLVACLTWLRFYGTKVRAAAVIALGLGVTCGLWFAIRVLIEG